MDKAQKIMKHNYYELYPKERVVDAFLKVIENIKGHLEAIKDQDTNKILEEIDKTKIDDEIRREEFLSKNVRVKPTPSRMDRRSSESLSNSKASISRDDGDFDESGDEDSKCHDGASDENDWYQLNLVKHWIKRLYFQIFSR